MLGQMAHIFFSKKYETLVFNDRYTFSSRYELLDKIHAAGDAIIINCVGKVKQKSSDSGDLSMVNSLLPLDISNSLNDNQILIHPSTDCVFDGKIKKEYSYSIDDLPNARDDYGWSKRLGEVALLGKKNAYIIRVSIIGPDSKSTVPKGLLGWFLSNQNNAVINGYQNHFWNGITTLEWCKTVDSIIHNDLKRELTGKIIQLGTNVTYSKLELLELFQKIYKTSYQINKFIDSVSINRTLKPTISCPSLESQLIELKDYL